YPTTNSKTAPAAKASVEKKFVSLVIAESLLELLGVDDSVMSRRTWHAAARSSWQSRKLPVAVEPGDARRGRFDADALDRLHPGHGARNHRAVHRLSWQLNGVFGRWGYRRWPHHEQAPRPLLAWLPDGP